MVLLHFPKIFDLVYRFLDANLLMVSSKSCLILLLYFILLFDFLAFKYET